MHDTVLPGFDVDKGFEQRDLNLVRDERCSRLGHKDCNRAQRPLRTALGA